MHYEDLIERLRRGTGLPVLKALMNEAADAIEQLTAVPIIRMKDNLPEEEKRRLVELLDRNFGYVEEEPATVVADRIIAAGFVRSAEPQTDCEKLIDALKKCNYPGSVHHCGNGCVMSVNRATCGLAPLLHKAADAMEELSQNTLRFSAPGLISVEDRLPEEPYACLLIVDDTEPYTGKDFLNYLPYFAGWDGSRWNDADGDQVPFEVRYWMPLPELPKEEADGTPE